MKPGPDIIFECPKCSKLISRHSITSGNTIGAKFYSDGKMIAPMFSEYPDITICPECGTIFWFKKARRVGDYYYWEHNNDPHFEDSILGESLKIPQYFHAIENKIFETKNDEISLRTSIWWLFNDRVREGNPIFENDLEESQWSDNLYALLNLLNEEDPDQCVMITEIYRNLGDFRKCLETLSKIKDPEKRWLKIAFIDECHKKNREVFVLKH